METLPLQLFCHLHRPDQSRFDPVTGVAGNGKPRGGLWTSTWETAFEDGWPSWCLREQYGGEFTEGWLLQPRPCRVLTIDGKASAVWFMEQYGADLARSPGYSMWLPEWVRVAQDFDAVRLTAPYDPELRFSNHEKISGNFYGWDCESTVWLSWQFEGEPEAVDLREKAKAVVTYWDDE